MKSIRIQLSDVEAAMLIELQRHDRSFMSLDRWMQQKIRDAYQRIPQQKKR